MSTIDNFPIITAGGFFYVPEIADLTDSPSTGQIAFVEATGLLYRYSGSAWVDISSAFDIEGLDAATVATGDLVMIADINDSNLLKKVTAQSIADLATGVTSWTGLSDTPGTLTASKFVAVNVGGTALELVDPPVGGLLIEGTGANSLYTPSVGTADPDVETIAVGANIVLGSGCDRSVVMGRNATLGDNSSWAVVIGPNAYTTAGDANSVVIGPEAGAGKSYCTAIGSVARANGNNSTSIGRNTTASHVDSTALGYGAVTAADNELALGSTTSFLRISGTSIVIPSSDVDPSVTPPSYPATPVAGEMVFEADAGKIWIYDGSTWQSFTKD